MADAGVEGAYRFLRRLWSFAAQHAGARSRAAGDAPTRCGAAKALRREMHTVLRQVSYDYDRMQYNTVVSGAMKLLNALEAARGRAAGAPTRRCAKAIGILLRALYPACPHITQALWHELGYADAARRPARRAVAGRSTRRALVQDEIELMLQVNGKLRGAIGVPATADKAAIEAAALASPGVRCASPRAGRSRRSIVVPGRLVNVVV